jgi:hypothetical protein
MRERERERGRNRLKANIKNFSNLANLLCSSVVALVILVESMGLPC